MRYRCMVRPRCMDLSTGHELQTNAMLCRDYELEAEGDGHVLLTRGTKVVPTGNSHEYEAVPLEEVVMSRREFRRCFERVSWA